MIRLGHRFPRGPQINATPDSEFTSPEHCIADLERQLAECKAERDEGLQREIATAEVLGVINSSHGDLALVFDAILTKATGLCEAIYGTLCTFDGEGFHPTTIHGDREFADWLRQRSPLLPLPRSPFERIVLGERFVHIADTEKDSIYHSPGFRELVEIGRIRSHLVVALRKDDRLVGTLVVFRREVHPFTDRQVALLQSFAAQAVIAMENARLLDELRQRTRDLEESLEYQTATADVLRVISHSTFDLQPVLESVFETTMRLCGNDNGEIFRLKEGAYRLAVARGLPLEYVEIERRAAILPGRETLVGRAALEARPVQIYDAWTDPDYSAKEEAR